MHLPVSYHGVTNCGHAFVSHPSNLFHLSCLTDICPPLRRLSNLAVTGLTRYALLEAELLRRVIPLALPWKKSKIPDALEMQVSYSGDIVPELFLSNFLSFSAVAVHILLLGICLCHSLSLSFPPKLSNFALSLHSHLFSFPLSHSSGAGPQQPTGDHRPAANDAHRRHPALAGRTRDVQARAHLFGAADVGRGRGCATRDCELGTAAAAGDVRSAKLAAGGMC